MKCIIFAGGKGSRIRTDEDFALTYADAVSDINIDNLIEYHKKHKKLLTLSVFKTKKDLVYLK